MDINIINESQVIDDITFYKERLGSAITIDELHKELQQLYDIEIGDTFGISVSKNWEDKCLTFSKRDESTFEYLGISKT